MNDLISIDVCADCPDHKCIRDEPPYWVCAKTPYGDHECNTMLATWELTDFATEIAPIIAGEMRHVPRDERRQLAESIAESIADAVDALGAVFDSDVFLAMAGMGTGAEQGVMV